jgi:hypothetical protein
MIVFISRLDCLKTAMDKQTEFLKLIVKKMEIKSEAEEFEEETETSINSNNANNRLARTRNLYKKSLDLVNVTKAFSSYNKK